MPTFDSSGPRGKADEISNLDSLDLPLEEDLLMEQILDIRRQITQGRYDLNKRLDVALEKVLDDLTL